jgi:hypothetical protein
MSDDTEAAALHAWLETIIKETEDAEAQAAAARRHVQAAHLLLTEESKATVCIGIFPVRGPVARPHHLFDLQRHSRRRTSPSGGCSTQRPSAGEHRPRLLHQLHLLA